MRIENWRHHNKISAKILISEKCFNRRCGTEIRRRIWINKEAFQNLGRILRNPKIWRGTRKRLLNCCVESAIVASTGRSSQR